ncbi:MAG: thioredoxin family protein [Pseudoflavonifractor sp.]|nr:thioredoxin family protein [Pseudoflavonifractor sp.]
MKRLLLLTVVALVSLMQMPAQILEPIKWTTTLDRQSDTEVTVKFAASIEDGWHLYGLDLPEGGPSSTSVDFTTIEGVEPVGGLVSSVPTVDKVDMIFNLRLSWWESDVTLSQRFKVVGKDGYKIAGTINFMGCNDQSCMPPQKEEFSFVSSSSDAGSEAADTVAVSSIVAPVGEDGGDSGWWAPVKVGQASDSEASVAQSPWWYILIWGFVGGLVALLTPCVWPMIPLTVSFFLKKSQSRRRSVTDAILYGAAIIVIYLVLGLVITAVFGAGKLNDLSTNAVFNLIFFLLLVVFAVSFFGAFDIRLPSSWSSRMDNNAERTTGVISIFFMAFTLVLVSFSCTGPIIGTLLVEAASLGDISGPAIGMGGFALGLALPFALFAIFPSWLKEMPRSGGWLNSVKVVLGFLELALSLKFLSVADLAYGWGILDREVFVSLWVVIFLLLGLYLLGKIRFSHDSECDSVPVGRFFLALVSLSFSVYLLPGLWGAPLKGVSAFVPPLYTQDFNLYAGGRFQEFDDYDEGMRFAAENGRPVLIDFSGYGCVNCRKMEGAVFDTQEISSVIKENFVLIKLMVDDKHQLATPINVTENGKRVKIETVGEKWSYLQRHKFGANSQPYYITLDNDGQPLSPAYYYDESVSKFAEWLKGAVDNYTK